MKMRMIVCLNSSHVNHYLENKLFFEKQTINVGKEILSEEKHIIVREPYYRRYNFLCS